MAGIPPCGLFTVDAIKLSLITESSKFAFMNLIGAVALNSSLPIPNDWIRLAPDDFGLF